MSSSDLKAIVVGTGFGCRIQIPALRGAGFEVVGLVGQDAARTAERAKVNGVAAAFTDLGEAIDATGATAVAISTPPHTHAELTLAAIERGCHVLCEKPFSADAAEAQAMLDAAQAAGRVHMMGHEFRFEPLRATVANAIAEGVIGDPRLASLVLLLPQIPTQEAEMPDWWFDPAEGGGWLGALGSHVIDQLRTWLGEFAAVSATLTSVTATRGGADDSFTVSFRMKNGLDGVIQSSAGSWGPPLDVTRICGSEGTIWTEGGVAHFSGRSGERDLPVAPELTLPPPPPITDDPRHKTARWSNLVGVELAPYTVLCRSFRAAILGEDATSPIVPATFADGVAAMKVMDSIRASAADGGKLVELN
ncbi:MAG: Gfo/Idh/MocA family oxidoreductase [Novosphingobium sp.]|nr:Gfo/Idh/MocA family oxidoreductase [Novosphingobium sp.]MCP5402926.1 Gfo/Idh/MocA family oxidoreductase [Novosphingobium sp.]